MEMSLYQGLICSTIQPTIERDVIIAQNIQSCLGKVPTSIDEAEQWLRSAVAGINNNYPVQFPHLSSVDTTDVFGNDSYTEFKTPDISLTLDIPSPGSTSKARLYGAVFRWEAYRIKESLVKYANDTKDDVLARKEVTLTMVYLKRDIHNVATDLYGTTKVFGVPLGIEGEIWKRKRDEVYNILDDFIRVMFWLYYDLALTFQGILEPEDIVPVQDLCSFALYAFPAEFDVVKKISALFVISDAIKDMSSAESLKSLYEVRKSGLELAFMSTLIARVENELYQPVSGLDAEHYTYSNIRKNIASEIREHTDGRLILELIEQKMDTITELGITASDSESIPVKVLSYLQENKDLYKDKIDKSFVPSGKAKSSIGISFPAPFIQPADVNEQKQIARKHLAHFGGLNKSGQAVMSQSEFERLLSYVDILVETGHLPDTIDPIKTTRLTLGHVQHVFYLIHEELYTSRPIRPEWIHFITSVFFKFKEKPYENIYRKWANPKEYNSDMAAIKKVASRK